MVASKGELIMATEVFADGLVAIFKLPNYVVARGGWFREGREAGDEKRPGGNR